jgi:hypothetical protein
LFLRRAGTHKGSQETSRLAITLSAASISMGLQHRKIRAWEIVLAAVQILEEHAGGDALLVVLGRSIHTNSGMVS